MATAPQDTKAQESTKAVKDNTPELTIEQIEAQLEKLTKLKADKLTAERTPALERVLSDIKKYSFTAQELGIKAAASKNEGEATESKPRNTIKPIKSIAAAGVSVWLAHPPKFLEAEGAHTAYKAGKSVDQWLVDPANKVQKANFLAKLAKKHEKKATKEQLGEVTEAEVTAAAA